MSNSPKRQIRNKLVDWITVAVAVPPNLPGVLIDKWRVDRVKPGELHIICRTTEGLTEVFTVKVTGGN